MPPERIKEIRKRYAKSTKDFERRFGIPAGAASPIRQDDCF
eukprot:gene28064-33977_t